MAISVPSDVVLPKLDIGYADTTIDGVEYRVRTFSVAGASIALGAARRDSAPHRQFGGFF